MRNPRGQAGASDQLARRSQASTPEKPDHQPPLDAVSVFAPWAGPEERQLRVRIHKARDVAQARAGRSRHGRARSIYWIASQFSSDWVFQRAALDDLEEVINGLTWLFLFAGLVERLEAPDE